MKNLRKILAVVLVICMAFSLMAVASAKQITDYSDASSVKYTEAVDLMTGLGIMTGAGGTTFDPTTTFTREMAAKVICHILLGGTVANSLTTSTSSFKDVAATRWSAPFIEYCAANNIINGVGDGNFAPAAPITGTAMAKLLLAALGYGAKGEYTGANWEINTLVKAQTLGILDTGVNYSAAATREQVAKYIFNVLTKAACFTVTYNPVTGTYVGNYTQAGAVATDPEKLAGGLGKLTFMLTKTTAGDGASYPNITAHFWKAYITAATVSGTYSDDIVLATSTDGTALSGAYSLTTAAITNPFYKASTAATVDIYYNGVLVLNDAADFTGIVTGAVTANAMASIPGVIVKLLDNVGFDGVVDTVSLIQKTAFKLTAVPAVDAITGMVTFAGVGAGTFTKGTIVYPTGLAVRDVVSYVLYGVTAPKTFVEKDTKVTGMATASTATTLTFAGTKYTLAGTTGVSFFNMSSSTSYNAAATAWVDSNGYLVNVALDAPAALPYGLLVGYNYVAATGAGLTAVPAYAKARLYTADGAVKVYDVATGAGGVVPNQGDTTASDFDFVGQTAYIVTYTIDSNGKVSLTRSTTTADNSAAAAIPAGSALVQLDGGNKYVTASTRIIYFDKDAAYSTAAGSTNVALFVTGYTSAKQIPANTDVQYIASTIPGLTNNIDVILVDVAQTATTVGNFAYVVNPAYGTHFVGTTQYFDYTLFINGTSTPVSSETDDLFASAGYYSYSKDADGYIVGTPTSIGAVDTGTVSDVGASYVAYSDNGVNTALVYDSSTQFYKVIPFVMVTNTGVFTLTSGTTTTITNVQVNPTTGVATAVYYTVS